MTNGCDAFVDKVIGSANAPDGIVDVLRAIEGHDDVVEAAGNLLGAFVQEKPRGQKSEVNVLFTKKVTEGYQIVVQQRFATCKNDLTDIKLL
jgi:hypothetical protein